MNNAMFVRSPTILLRLVKTVIRQKDYNVSIGLMGNFG